MSIPSSSVAPATTAILKIPPPSPKVGTAGGGAAAAGNVPAPPKAAPAPAPPAAAPPAATAKPAPAPPAAKPAPAPVAKAPVAAAPVTAALPSIDAAAVLPPAVTAALPPGMTISELIFARMPGATVAEKLAKTAQVLKMNGLTWDTAKSVPAGFQLKLPQELSRDGDAPIAPGTAAPTPAAPAPGAVAPAPATAPAPAPAAPAPAPPIIIALAPTPTAAPVATPVATPVSAPAQFSQPAVAQTQTPAVSSSGTDTPRPNDPNHLTVAQIDTFFTDNTGFNHGAEIAKTIQSGGADPAVAGQVDLLQYRVDGSGPLDTTLSARTADALQDVINRVKSGQDIDAVNMSLQDFAPSANTDRVRALVQQLTDMNVPVLIAAGNAGPNAVNQITTPNAFVIQSATNGVRNANSGIGNTQGESSTTSFATATLSPQIAAMANSGMTVQQIRALMGM